MGNGDERRRLLNDELHGQHASDEEDLFEDNEDEDDLEGDDAEDLSDYDEESYLQGEELLR